jgi:hypothetical protein
MLDRNHKFFRFPLRPTLSYGTRNLVIADRWIFTTKARRSGMKFAEQRAPLRMD